MSYMLDLVDGPAKGAYSVKRAPIFLRAVVDSVSGDTDVLNEVEDLPHLTEKVFVYKQTGEAPMTAHLLMSPRSKSGFYTFIKYKHIGSIDGETMRDNEAWKKYVAAQFPAGAVDMQTGAIKPEVC